MAADAERGVLHVRHAMCSRATGSRIRPSGSKAVGARCRHDPLASPDVRCRATCQAAGQSMSRSSAC